MLRDHFIPMTATLDSPQIRHIADRRQQATPLWSRYWLRGRRRGGRRSEESTGVYVDRYQAGEIALVLAVVAMSTIDLLATLLHLADGGDEANPLMAAALSASGNAGFAVTKLLATAGGGVFLLLHVRFAGVRRALQLLVATYALVMLWHVVVAIDRI